MAFVIDASILGSWAFPDEDDPASHAAWDRIGTEDALGPALLWFELRNILIVNERRGRITESATAEFLRHVARLPFSLDRDPDEGEVLRLARTHRLTVYDAAYLELASRTRSPLATLDARLAAAALAEGVPLIS